MTLPIRMPSRVRLPSWPLLLAVVLAAFLPALDGAFLSWDDQTYLEESAIQGVSLFWERLAWIFSTSYFANYNPLHRLGNWLQLSLWGRDPRLFHLVSILLHAGSVLLVFGLVRRLRFAKETALLAALLFAAHPSRVEAVAWISAQKDLGSSLIALAALVIYAPILTGDSRRRATRLLAVGLCFLLALLYKSMLVTFPLLLLLLDLAWKRPFRTAFLEKVPFFAIAAAFAVLTLDAAPRTEPLGGSWESHFATALKAPWIYLARILWPAGYSARWWVERPATFLSPAPLASLVCLCSAAASALVLLRGRHRRRVLLLAAWPAASMLPVMNLVPIPIVVADRYLYLALLGPFLVAADCWNGLGQAAHRRVPRSVLRFGAAASIASLSLITHSHCGAYRDTETLWRTSFEAQPHNPVARLYLALELVSTRPDAARAAQSLEVLDAQAAEARARERWLVARAMALDVLGRKEEARAEVDRALEIGRQNGLRWETAVAAARSLVEQGDYSQAHAMLEASKPRSQMDEQELAQAHADVALRAKDDQGFFRWNARLLEWSPFSLILWHNRETTARRLGLARDAELAAARFEALLGN